MRWIRTIFLTTLLGAPLSCASRVDTSSFEVGMAAQNDDRAVQEIAPNPGAPLRLEVTVTRVEVHVAPVGINAPSDDEADAGGWITVFSGERSLDLLDLRKNEALLGGVTLSAGSQVTQIRLVLTEDVVLIDGLRQEAVKCPSCAQSGLKFIPQKPLVIPADGTLHVTLSIDVARSLTLQGGKWMLHPVIDLRS